MLALLLSFAIGASVYGTGSVELDTVSACMPMTEFRKATSMLEERELLVESDRIHEQRHKADSAARASSDSAHALEVKAHAQTKTALALADSTRKACVETAGSLEKSAWRRGFFIGLGVGSGVGVVVTGAVSVYLFVVSTR